jgi:N-acetyl-gamma-glutamyl-phosphate reductase
MSRIPVAIVGASGYTGGELVRLLLGHPNVAISGLFAKRTAGGRLGDVFPQFAGALDMVLEAFDADAVAARARVVFSALPHGESAPIVRALYERGATVLDLSADLRLRDARVYETWYGHPGDPLAQHAVYGLPELGGIEPGVRLVAVPGCYPTASILALRPLLAAGLIAQEGIIIDAKSGTTGAGRAATPAVHFSEMGEGVRAYKVGGTHRHIPEIEQALGVAGITLTPHLLPMTRGMLAVCYATPVDPDRPASAYRDALAQFCAGKTFLRVVDHPPDTTHVRGSNRAQLSVAYDARARRVTAMCAIDNLGKGASGQAVQCMNRVLGLPETAGLEGVGLFP